MYRVLLVRETCAFKTTKKTILLSAAHLPENKLKKAYHTFHV